VEFLMLAAPVSSLSREDHARCAPKQRVAQTFMEVTAFPPEVCKPPFKPGSSRTAAASGSTRAASKCSYQATPSPPRPTSAIPT